MNELLLLKGNPSRRRGKRRTAAQRAATARMLSANRSRFHRNPSRRKRRASSSVRRFRRNPINVSSMTAGMGNLVKQGAIMGAGALTADVAMGYVNQFFGASIPTLTTPLNADGSVNYMYYLTKGALIYALAKVGRKVTNHAPEMAKGAYAVILYNLMKTFIPAGSTVLPLGYFNPGRIVSGGQLGRIMRGSSPAFNNAQAGLGRVVKLPGSGQGAAAANMIRNVNGVTAPALAVRQGNLYTR